MRLIYLSVEVLGGIAIVILVVSYIAHRIKIAKEPKVYETKVDKEKELKMILKDKNSNKEIVKGALSTKDSKKKVSKQVPQSSKNRGKASSAHSSSRRNRTSSSRGKSSTAARIPKVKKKLPSRDTRIQILNSLSKTHSDAKNNKEKEEKKNSFNKFYDITDDD